MAPLTPLKITTIPVWPATNVRSTQGDRWILAATDEYLRGYDERQIEKKGKPGRTLDRKRQLEKYNAYKQEVRYWCEKNQFIVPAGDFAMWFYIPFPKSWRRKKRLEMAGKPHMNTPDLDNLIKAIFDSVMPRRNRLAGQKGSDDRRIHMYVAGKIWVPPGEERIDIVEYNEADFRSVFSYINPQHPTYF